MKTLITLSIKRLTILLLLVITAVSLAQTETVFLPPEDVWDSQFGQQVAIADSHFVSWAVSDKAIYLYHLNAGSWSLAGKLHGYTAEADFVNSTISLDASPEYVVIGNKADDVWLANYAYAEDAGSVAVYRRLAHNSWVKEATLFAGDAVNGLKFGKSISIWEDYMIVGARDKAYVYERDALGHWVEVDQLSPPGILPEDEFGGAVSVSGPFAVVGALGYNSTAGAAFVYQRSDDGTSWDLQQTLEIDTGLSTTAYFGNAVANYFSYINVGAFFYDYVDGGDLPGAAFIFELVDGQWEETAILEPATASGELFGSSVSHYGLSTFVGEPLNGGITDLGHAVLFQKSGDDWQQSGLFPLDNSFQNACCDEFGHSVDIFDGRGIVGKNVSGEDYVVLYDDLPGADIAEIDGLKETTVPAGGGKLEYVIHLMNSGKVTKDIVRWQEMIKPDGQREILSNRFKLSLKPGENITITEQVELGSRDAGGQYFLEAHWEYNGIENLRILPFTKKSGKGNRLGNWRHSSVTRGASYLASNTPNPFNPTTTIRYRVSEAGPVSLVVFDIAGRTIATLVKESAHQSGEFSAMFNATHLPSGIYLYRLEATGYNQVRKMMLVK